MLQRCSLFVVVWAEELVCVRGASVSGENKSVLSGVKAV